MLPHLARIELRPRPVLMPRPDVLRRWSLLSSVLIIARAMPEGNIVGFAPPLCITRDEIDEAMTRLDKAAAAVGEQG